VRTCDPDPEWLVGRATYWLGAAVPGGDGPLLVSAGVGAFAYNEGSGPRVEARLRLDITAEWLAPFAAAAYEPDVATGARLAAVMVGIEVPWFFAWTWGAADPSPLLFRR
jgi:hypothetical protein